MRINSAATGALPAGTVFGGFPPYWQPWQRCWDQERAAWSVIGRIILCPQTAVFTSERNHVQSCCFWPFGSAWNVVFLLWHFRALLGSPQARRLRGAHEPVAFSFCFKHSPAAHVRVLVIFPLSVFAAARCT